MPSHGMLAAWAVGSSRSRLRGLPAGSAAPQSVPPAILQICSEAARRIVPPAFVVATAPVRTATISSAPRYSAAVWPRCPANPMPGTVPPRGGPRQSRGTPIGSGTGPGSAAQQRAERAGVERVGQRLAARRLREHDPDDPPVAVEDRSARVAGHDLGGQLERRANLPADVRADRPAHRRAHRLLALAAH